MLEVSEELKKAFMTDNVEKQIRITFPNGEHEDITNENIVANSMSLTESLCSQDELKFGLCEANVFKVTAECENIKGCQIEVFIDAYYGGEVFTVPYGVFTVESCKREAGTYLRDIEAYSIGIDGASKTLGDYEKWKANLPNVGNIGNEYVQTVESLTAPLITYDKQRWQRVNGGSNSITICNNKAEIFSDVSFYIEIGFRVFFQSPSTTYNSWRYIQRVKVNYKLDEIQKAQKVLDDFYKKYPDGRLYPYSESFCMDKTYAEMFEMLRPLKVFNRVAVYDNASMIYPLEEFYYLPVGTPIYMFNDLHANFVEYNQLVVPTSLRLINNYTKETIESYSLVDIASLYVEILEFNKHRIYPPENVVKFSYPKTIITSKKVGTKTYTFRTIDAKEYEKFDMVDIVNSYVELYGKFGIIDRYGGMRIFSINDNFALYPEDKIFPKGDLYPVIGNQNYQPLATTSFKAADYEEWETVKIGYVRVTYLATDNEKYSITVECDSRYPNVYEMRNNYFFLGKIWTANEVKEAIKKYFYPNVKDISYQPAEINIKGLPFMEAGDVIKVFADDGNFKTFVFRRTLSGEQVLTDTIEAKGEERYKNSDEWILTAGIVEKE